MKSNVNNCKIVSLSKVKKNCGYESQFVNAANSYFDVQRIYYLYDVPSDSERGGHAHKVLQQLLIAVSGSFDVILNDGAKEQIVHLDKPNKALLIVPGIWRELKNFSSGSVCLVLASTPYSESDYIRNFSDFEKYASK